MKKQQQQQYGRRPPSIIIILSTYGTVPVSAKGRFIKRKLYIDEKEKAKEKKKKKQPKKGHGKDRTRPEKLLSRCFFFSSFASMDE
ncbi:hypothetical protein TEQG_08610 [Trichophyton equinum CBS 127.97]|uniref:Uncharacterized protein n=1 Tax=Trichophyton equinum (strain ATCC MYA-4606 / CBS 127.97) TaxID=559882 RepID=F2PKS0_TRIEC|nr:hypothetical protein TEQG_08610 [Trichophyton equinum CBS 127.97]